MNPKLNFNFSTSQLECTFISWLIDLLNLWEVNPQGEVKLGPH